MAIFGNTPADEMTLIERDAANRAAAYENLKRQGDLPALGLIFGLNLMKNSQTQGLGSAVGNAGMDALANHRAIMDARKKGIDADLNRQTELMRAQEDLNRRDRAFDFDLQKWDYQKEQDAIRNAMERTRIAQAGANAAWQRQMAQKAMEDAEAQKKWNETHFLDEKGVPRVFNPETGKWDEDTAAYRKDAEGNVLGVDPLYGVPKQPEQPKWTDFKGFMDKYDDATSTYNSAGEALRTLFVGAQQGGGEGNGIGDLQMIYALNKMFDPRSVVKESEIKSLAATGDLPTQVINYYNKIANGGRLTKEQRKEMLNLAYDLFSEQTKNKQIYDLQYRDIGNAFGFDSDKVIKDVHHDTALDVGRFLGRDMGNVGGGYPTDIEWQ